jgi:hypothetical protein
MEKVCNQNVIDQLGVAFDKILPSIQQGLKKDIIECIRDFYIDNNKETYSVDVFYKHVPTFIIAGKLSVKTPIVRKNLNELEVDNVVASKRSSNNIDWYMLVLDGFKDRFNDQLILEERCNCGNDPCRDFDCGIRE